MLENYLIHLSVPSADAHRFYTASARESPGLYRIWWENKEAEHARHEAGTHCIVSFYNMWSIIRSIFGGGGTKSAKDSYTAVVNMADGGFTGSRSNLARSRNIFTRLHKLFFIRVYPTQAAPGRNRGTPEVGARVQGAGEKPREPILPKRDRFTNEKAPCQGIGS